jgi:hypothetical protein
MTAENSAERLKRGGGEEKRTVALCGSLVGYREGRMNNNQGQKADDDDDEEEEQVCNG